MSHNIPKLALALIVVSTAIGCSSRVQVLNPRVGRTPVVYESDGGASAFERAVEERYSRGDASIGQGKMLSLNAFFNQQAELADGNTDGIISDSEAGRYAHNTATQ